MVSDVSRLNPQSEFLTTEQAAKLLRVVPLTVRRKIKNGTIRAIKRGKSYQIRRSELEPLMGLNDQKQNAGDLSVTLNIPSPQLREWSSLYLPMFKQFMENIMTSVKPAFIVLLDRKGARAIELMRLIPSVAEQITFSENAFKFKNEDALRREVHGKTVLILDELAQFARQMAELRKKFEDAGAEVVTACLLRRKTNADSGLLHDPKIRTCIDANDRAFAYHATMISQFIQVQGDTLDHDHATIEITVSGLRNKIFGILQLLAETGDIYFVAPDTELGEVVPVTLDRPFFMEISSLSKEWLVFDEGVVKLRIYFDLNRDVVTIVPVAFPGWRVPKTKIQSIELFVEELQKGPLDGFVYIPDGFVTLPEKLKAEYLYILLTLKLSLSLAQRLLQVLRYGGIEFGRPLLKKADFLQAFGVKGGNVLYKASQRIIEEGQYSPGLFDTILQIGGMSEKTEEIEETCHQSVDLVAEEVLELLRQRMRQNLNENGSLSSAGITFSEILGYLNREDPSHVSKLTLSRYMDTGLDGGCMKPITIVRDDETDPNYIVCLRGYRLGEYGHGEDSIAYTDVGRAKTRTVGILRYMIKRFGSAEGNPVRGVVQDVMANKLFTNLLHEWGRQRFERLYMEWTPYLYGPMVTFPETYGPQRAQYTLATFGPITSAYRTDFDDEHKVSGYKVIGEVSDLEPTALFSEAEAVYIDSLIESYSLIAKEIGEATAQPLMTLAACRNHRLTYVSANKELELWAEASSDLATAIQIHAKSQKKEQFLYETYLDRMRNPLRQIEDKLDRYRSLKTMQEKLLTMKAPSPLARTIKQIADSLEVVPVFDFARPYPLLGLQKAYQIAEAATSLVGNGLSALGLAKDRRTDKQKKDAATGQVKDLNYYLKQCESFSQEIEGFATAAKDFVGAVEKNDLPNLGKWIDVLVKNVYEAMYGFAPIPPLERSLRTPGWPEGGLELRNYFESLCHINVGLPGAFLCIDLRGTRDIPRGLAEILDSSDPDYERLKLVGLFGDIVATTAREHRAVIRKFISVNDCRMVVFGDADSAIEFASDIQARIMQKGYSSPIIGISWATPKLVPGGALDTGSIEAITLANISKKQTGVKYLVRRIFVTKQIMDRIRDPKMLQCFSSDKALQESVAIDFLDFDWQKYLGLRDSTRI